MSWLGTCRAITCPFLEHAELSHVLAWNMQSYHMSFLGTCIAITCPGLEHAELSHVLAWNMQSYHMSWLETCRAITCPGLEHAVQSLTTGRIIHPMLSNYSHVIPYNYNSKISNNTSSVFVEEKVKYYEKKA